MTTELSYITVDSKSPEKDPPVEWCRLMKGRTIKGRTTEKPTKWRAESVKTRKAEGPDTYKAGRMKGRKNEGPGNEGPGN